MGSIGEIFSVYRENLRLKDENARLRQWRNAAIVLDNRVKRYQLLLRAVPDPMLSSVMARVIGRSNQPFLQTMILDAGKAQGIKPGQAVIDARGMIGRIFLAGHHTSWVILLTDLNSRIPVRIRTGKCAGYHGGRQHRRSRARSAVAECRAEPGAQVVSSGDGGLLPPGWPIGACRQSVGRLSRRSARRFRIERRRQCGRLQAEDGTARPPRRPTICRRRLPDCRPAAPPAPVTAPPLNAAAAPATPAPQPPAKPLATHLLPRMKRRPKMVMSEAALGARR